MVAELVFICFPISIFLCCVRHKKNLWKCLFKKIDEIQKRNILFRILKNLWNLNLGNLAPSDTQLQIMPDLDALWYTIVNEILYTCLEEPRHLYFTVVWSLKALVFALHRLKVEKPRKKPFPCLTDIPKIYEKNIS